MKKYVIGIDFGTLSGRVLIVDALSGEELAEAVYEYPHAVMDRTLPDGTELKPKSALQHPADYLEVLRSAIPEALSKARLEASDIAGVGIDFTACTMLPIDEKLMPLCFSEKYASEPNAYVKLWKHHASQPQADKINSLAAEREEEWLKIYGGKISSEWMLPKILQILEESPQIYDATFRFTEAADWLSWLLTGNETHAAAFAGYKAIWNERSGYPSNDFFEALDSRMSGIVGSKLSKKVLPVSGRAGELNEYGAQLTGLMVGTPLSLPMLDAEAAMPALGIVGGGELMMILGTSGCYIINDEKRVDVSGICGYVKDAVVSGYYTYESGQSCLGDGYAWFVNNFVPEAYAAEARSEGISIHKLLRRKAQRLSVGESGLLVLDWFNGNRSVLSDSDLSGMILGLTLRTRPEEIYRAIIEATAFGAKMIIDTFEENGIKINSVCASGGIALKDELLMQIFADVTGRNIRVAGTTQAGALGSAVYASVACGIYKDLREAAGVMSRPSVKEYKPNTSDAEAYKRLYAEYKILHDYFGRGENNVMKRLIKT